MVEQAFRMTEAPVVYRLPRTHELALLGACLPLLLLPKINLVSFEGETAGIRIDDLILAIIAIDLALLRFVSGRWEPNAYERPFIWVVLTFLLSNMANMIAFGQSSVLYTLRMVEYFVFFYVGGYAARHLKIRPIAYAILVANGLVMIAQRMEWVGGFASAGVTDVVSDRVIGLTGGPWEVGAVMNILFGLIAFNTIERARQSEILLVFCVSLALIALTGARMPAIAHAALFLGWLFLDDRNRRSALGLGLVAAVGIVGLYIVPNPLVDRLMSTLDSQNMVQVKEYWGLFDAGDRFEAFPDLTQWQWEGDPSWVARIVKWSIAFELWARHAWTVLAGVGPGTFGPALDGGWIRLLTETGLIGFAAFGIFLFRVARIGPASMAGVVSLSLSMLMIDLHLSYKVMTLLFLAGGYFAFRENAPSRREVSARDDQRDPLRSGSVVTSTGSGT